MDHETDFLSGLIELQHGEKVVDKLKNISKKVGWAKGWPNNDQAFWSAEAYMWKWKIEKEKRESITNELKKVCSKNNLDLGAGANSYVSSTCFDFSDKALQLNDNCSKRVVGDLEQKLPFNNGEFDSVTAIFVLNYVDNLVCLLSEIARVLKMDGTFVAVFGAKGINEWQAVKEKNKFSSIEWRNRFLSLGFKVKFFEKSGLWFFVCKKQKDY